MARRVICKNCTNELTTDIAFKVTDEKGKNSYYCSKEEYEQMINEKTSKNKCLETIKEIMNIKMLPPIMVKKVNELRDFYDYIIIEKTFKESRESIEWSLESKEFNNEFTKAKYITSIVANNIDRVYKKHKKDMEDIERLFKKQDEVMVDIVDTDISRTKTNDRSDISEFLD